MTFFKITFLASFFLFSLGMAYGQSGSPVAAVNKVLTYEQRHDNARDMTFDQRNINIRKPWITTGLYSLLNAELARERKEARANPDEKPYFGDGLAFGPLKETCTGNGRTYKQQYSIGKARSSKGSATVPVSFFYNKACGLGEPVVYRFKLLRNGSGWLIDDVDYGTGGSLRKALTRES